MRLSHHHQERNRKQQAEGEKVSDTQSQLVLSPAAQPDVTSRGGCSSYNQNSLSALQMLVGKEKDQGRAYDQYPRAQVKTHLPQRQAAHLHDPGIFPIDQVVVLLSERIEFLFRNDVVCLPSFQVAEMVLDLPRHDSRVRTGQCEHGFSRQKALHIVSHFASRAVSICRLLFQRFHANLLQFTWNRRGNPTGKHGIGIANTVALIADGIALEWQGSSEQLIKDRTQRKDVTPGVELHASLGVLRREIFRGAEEFSRLRDSSPVSVQRTREAEIEQFRFQVGAYKDIRRL